jgi:hypothetical protein
MSDSISMLFEKIPMIKKMIKAVMEANGEHPPVFFTSDGKKKIEAKPVFFANDRDKDEVMASMKVKIQDGSVKEYVFVAESWCVETDKEETYKDYGSISKHPLKKEIMLMQYSSHKEEVLYKAAIIRSKGDKVSLGEWETFSTKSIDKFASNNTGRFNDMFGKAMSEFN